MDESIAILTFLSDIFMSLPICAIHTYEAFCCTLKADFEYISILLALLYTPELCFIIIGIFLGYLVGFILLM